MKRKETTKIMNNKGFSLVELIIVIAIMAILIGVLAPQYMRYVERSRKSTDVQNVASIISALQIYASDPMVEAANRLGAVSATDPITITITTTSEDVDDTIATNNSDLALTSNGINTVQLKSSSWLVGGSESNTITLTVTMANGVVDVDSNVDDDAILTGVYED